MLGGMSVWHWLIVLLVVVLIFGTKKLANLGGDLGKAVKGFKEGMKDATEDSDQAKTAEAANPKLAEGAAIEGEVKAKEETKA